ncbi:hypothetical protein GCM10008992_31650 [Halorubrum aquaticum]
MLQSGYISQYIVSKDAEHNFTTDNIVVTTELPTSSLCAILYVSAVSADPKPPQDGSPEKKHAEHAAGDECD